MFAVCEFGMSIFKALCLIPQPSVESVLHGLAILLFLIITETGRIYLGRKGNFTEQGPPLMLGILLTIPSALATIYFLYWQMSVLRLERILCCIQLFLHATESVISIMCLVAIYRPPSTEE
ncbi:transmembrane protein 216-like [Diprion similis]|uniref:transmembrane protein 216-like n=1 Tax=Diprion similis TaxID=362088 RepID=UPI001EF82956|nr:transmembrane protein 216-like [Diprion similis]